MKCPVCSGKTRTIDKREPSEVVCTVHRTVECLDCLTRFKTSEKVVFTSLPSYIREKFLSEGKRK